MKKRRFKKGSILILILIVILIVLGIIFLLKPSSNIHKDKLYDCFISSQNNSVSLYDKEFRATDKISRGVSVKTNKKDITNENTIYNEITYNDKKYYVLKDDLTSNKDDIIKEEKLYVRTPLVLYKDDTSNKIESSIKKGEKLEIIGYDKIDDNGYVNKYKVKYDDKEGYVLAKYLQPTKEDALKVYDENGLQEYMESMGDYLGGGSAVNLDFYPYEKPKFEDNVMPDEVRALYINGAAIKNIDSYIALAKESNINAFVIDIKDDSTPSYNSNVMKEYSKTNYEKAINEYEDFKGYVKKAKDEGFYLIGRITTFKDSFFASDHSEVAIVNNNGQPFSHNGSYWPTAYNRYVWEFNVSLGIEAVKEIGFNEIQFDYVRFPDRTGTLEKNGTISLNNKYNEDKAQAIQQFVMYACDEIHAVGGYVSIDVFGESSSNYVTAYGQFWPAISNVADAISGMPYPDHFNAHEYGISEVVWTVPYKILNAWGATVAKKQSVIPTPAKVRTWIQTYNTTKSPSVIYDASKISDQIQALYDNGLTGGYMTWNSASNIDKYKSVSEAFKKEYK